MVSLTHSSYAGHADVCKPLVANCTAKYTNCTSVALVSQPHLLSHTCYFACSSLHLVQLGNSTRVNGTLRVLFRYEYARLVPNANLLFR